MLPIHAVLTFESASSLLPIFLRQAAVDGFLEELIVRRELADNFCFVRTYMGSNLHMRCSYN